MQGSSVHICGKEGRVKEAVCLLLGCLGLPLPSLCCHRPGVSGGRRGARPSERLELTQGGVERNFGEEQKGLSRSFLRGPRAVHLRLGPGVLAAPGSGPTPSALLLRLLVGDKGWLLSPWLSVQKASQNGGALSPSRTWGLLSQYARCRNFHSGPLFRRSPWTRPAACL